ncbi:hypothetical protein [Flavobacterium humi]|uniref:DUF2007 domain-containing protein n=1 Tax=Flavobacterium humi TaxID=2562683 RepID=A0A4Z0L9V4_9FLAO|nr:hypothetical protein [Flavobacterium humi]TGD59089.1 hypothetical protein E4635_04350 [Flavobacterium humi]
MEFLTFQRFDKKDDILSFSDILTQNGIESFIEDTGNSLDSNLGNSQFAIEYHLKIKKSDFEKAKTLAQEISEKQLEEVDHDYFLFGFSNEELNDVILKKDEWGDFNFALALKILEDRGQRITQEQINDLEKERLTELAKPTGIQKEWVLFGYAFAFLGGVLGVLTGWYLMTLKKTLPNGEVVYSYLPSDRKHGKKIFVIGVVFSIIWAVIWIVKKIK